MLDDDLCLENYNYDLPKHCIAYEPIKPKEKAKLLVFNRSLNKIIHTEFGALCEFLPKCSIVFNDTKVIKARIYAYKQSGAKCEFFIHKALKDDEFLVQIKGRVRQNDILTLNDDLRIKILALNADGTRKICFLKGQNSLNSSEVFALLDEIGHIPLPPYIKRADTKQDSKDYQSVFAKNLGAIAAPTASLHFSKDLLKELSKAHKIYTLTLHIGAGTFKGVECENISQHKMHEEFYCLNEELSRLINSDEALLGVGTSVTRCIEHYARTHILQGECSLFLHPLNKPIRQNYLLTNFHLPKSTLIMLVASFIGRKKTLELYGEAIKKGYRFYSYGDAMLII